MIFLWLSCRKVSIWIGKYRYKNRYPECHFQRTEKNGPISAGENGFKVFKGQTISHFPKTGIGCKTKNDQIDQWENKQCRIPQHHRSHGCSLSHHVSSSYQTFSLAGSQYFFFCTLFHKLPPILSFVSVFLFADHNGPFRNPVDVDFVSFIEGTCIF